MYRNFCIRYDSIVKWFLFANQRGLEAEFLCFRSIPRRRIILLYYITYQDIIDINLWCQKIVEHSIMPTEGIREYNLLKSIPESIKQSFAGEELYPTVYDKGTHLWFSLSQYHCFADGNKRTALVTTIAYLMLNGFEFEISNDDLYKTCIELASGKLNRQEVSRYLMSYSTKNEQKAAILFENVTKILEHLSKDFAFIAILEKLGY